MLEDFYNFSNKDWNVVLKQVYEYPNYGWIAIASTKNEKIQTKLFATPLQAICYIVSELRRKMSVCNDGVDCLINALETVTNDITPKEDDLR